MTVCDGKVKDSGGDKSVFAIDCSSNGRGCIYAVGGFVEGGIVRCDAVQYGAFRGDGGP